MTRGRGRGRGRETPPDQAVPGSQQRGAVGGDGDISDPGGVQRQRGADTGPRHRVPDLRGEKLVIVMTLDLDLLLTTKDSRPG